MFTKRDERIGQGFEIQFYDSEGVYTYVISADTSDEVAICLAQMCWSNANGISKPPTIWKDGMRWPTQTF